MPHVAPAHWAALALAVAGAGLLAAAVLAEPPMTARLVLGIVLVVAALLTSGVQLLVGHAAPAKQEET